jgi:hypothetical protein
MVYIGQNVEMYNVEMLFIRSAVLYKRKEY